MILAQHYNGLLNNVISSTFYNFLVISFIQLVQRVINANASNSSQSTHQYSSDHQSGVIIP